MALIKRRPTVKLFAPTPIPIGSPFIMRAVLDCKRPVEVDAIDMELTGEVMWSDGSGSSSAGTARLARFVAHAPLQSDVLPEGQHEFAGRFEIPADLPGTYNGGALRVRWTAKVHVDIPWWPDTRAKFVLTAIRPTGAIAGGPHIFSTGGDGPRGNRPYVEVSIASNVIEAGGKIVGRAALANTAVHNYRALVFSLVSHETMKTGFLAGDNKHRSASWRMPLHNPGENEPLDFALKVSSLIPTAFRTASASVRWAFEVRVELAWALDVFASTPLQIQVGASPVAEERALPPAVGSDRLDATWSWVAQETGFNLSDGGLTREIGICRLSVRHEQQGRRGVVLVGEASFRDLDLGLEASRGGLRVRDIGQTQALAAATGDAAKACPVAHADDRRIRCETQSFVSSAKAIVGFVNRFVALIGAFEATREELPAPADVEDLLPAFRNAAWQLGGDLDAASMDVRGVRDEMKFSLEMQWSGQDLVRTMLAVWPLIPIDARHHRAAEDTPSQLPEGLDPIVAGSSAVTIDARSIQVTFPPRSQEIQELSGRLEALIAVGLKLSGRGGTYR